MSNDVTQSVREQLVTWLTAQLSAAFPELIVLQEWPSGPLPSRFVISILTAGDAQYFYHQPVVVSSVVGSGQTGTVTYSYGRGEGLPLELDCWTRTKPDRDVLAKSLRRALTVPPATSLGGASLPRLGRSPALSLALANLFGAVWTYHFNPVPTIDENSGDALQSRWRSHWRGTADGALLEQDVTALMKRIHISGTLRSPAALTFAVNRPKTATALNVGPRAAILSVGKTLQLQAVVSFDDGTTSDVTATAAWVSSDITKATVNSTGLVTRVAGGAVTITATALLVSGPASLS